LIEAADIDALARAWVTRATEAFCAVHPDATSEELYKHLFELFLTDVNFRTVVTNALVRQKDPACTASVVAVIVGDRTLPCVPEPARQN
jgi:hypothetical protein